MRRSLGNTGGLRRFLDCTLSRKGRKFLCVHLPLVLMTLACHKADEKPVAGIKNGRYVPGFQRVAALLVCCCLMHDTLRLPVQEEKLSFAHPVAPAESTLDLDTVPLHIGKDIHPVGHGVLRCEGSKAAQNQCQKDVSLDVSHHIFPPRVAAGCSRFGLVFAM